MLPSQQKIERVKARPRAPTRKSENAVDRRQNHKNVKAVSPRHCATTSVLRSCCLNCCAEQSHKDNVRSTAVEKQLRQKKANSQAQLHLPTLDLFWANLRVQHHLLPLDLAWTVRILAQDVLWLRLKTPSRKFSNVAESEDDRGRLVK